jgi:hypothetical protein
VSVTQVENPQIADKLLIREVLIKHLLIDQSFDFLLRGQQKVKTFSEGS